MNATARLLDSAQNVRRLVPPAAVPALVRRRVAKLWTDAEFRTGQEQQMELLLTATERAAEVPELARRMAEHGMARRWLRWHPRTMTSQRVVGVEELLGRDRSRPAVLSFMHHHHYEGMFASIARHGVALHIVGLDEVVGSGASVDLRQHMRVVARGGTVVSTAEGSAGLRAILQPGVILAIASDVPSRTPVEFLGRRFRGSSGAARLASSTDSPVFVVTAQRDARGSPYLQVHPALDPRDVDTPEELLARMLRIHGAAVLAWPEAMDNPAARWGLWEGA